VEVTLSHYLVLSAVLFAIGVYGILTRRNAIALLMCIELMLNAVNINLVAMNRFLQPDWRIVTGQIFAGFIIVLAAAEAAVGFALVIAIYRNLDRPKVVAVIESGCDCDGTGKGVSAGCRDFAGTRLLQRLCQQRLLRHVLGCHCRLSPPRLQANRMVARWAKGNFQQGTHCQTANLPRKIW